MRGTTSKATQARGDARAPCAVTAVTVLLAVALVVPPAPLSAAGHMSRAVMASATAARRAAEVRRRASVSDAVADIGVSHSAVSRSEAASVASSAPEGALWPDGSLPNDSCLAASPEAGTVRSGAGAKPVEEGAAAPGASPAVARDSPAQPAGEAAVAGPNAAALHLYAMILLIGVGAALLATALFIAAVVSTAAGAVGAVVVCLTVGVGAFVLVCAGTAMCVGLAASCAVAVAVVFGAVTFEFWRHALRLARTVCRCVLA
jgi:hypothetical protein